MDQASFSVLLVDDDPHTRNIFELVMAYHQLPVEIMGDAEAAIDYLTTHVADIVVIDLFLPGLDGYQALKHIRASARDPKCKVIATTAYYTNDTQQEVLRRGFDGYLPKPFEAVKLVAYLESIVNREES